MGKSFETEHTYAFFPQMAPWYQFLQVLKYFFFVPITCWRAQTFWLWVGARNILKRSFCTSSENFCMKQRQIPLLLKCKKWTSGFSFQGRCVFNSHSARCWDCPAEFLGKTPPGRDRRFPSVLVWPPVSDGQWSPAVPNQVSICLTFFPSPCKVN